MRLMRQWPNTVFRQHNSNPTLIHQSFLCPPKQASASLLLPLSKLVIKPLDRWIQLQPLVKPVPFRSALPSPLTSSTLSAPGAPFAYRTASPALGGSLAVQSTSVIQLTVGIGNWKSRKSENRAELRSLVRFSLQTGHPGPGRSDIAGWIILKRSC